MGHFFFYLAVVAACLLWSAAFTAAAARSRPGWVRRMLAAAAVIVPPLALAPWVFLTGRLLAMGLPTNWFAPTLTSCLVALVGGAWILLAGLAPRAAAATWPLVGLAGLFVLAKAVAVGTLLFIDNAVAAEGRMLWVEAAQIMATLLPPAPAPDDNAAPLYRRAFAEIAADAALAPENSPAQDPPFTVDTSAPEATAILKRHAATLDLLRRAIDRPGCRFDRDWSRPSFDMLLEESQSMREAARLLVLAARRAAADGDGAGALADIVRIHRLGLQTASEPFLVSCLVGQAIDRLALETLADTLPRLDEADLHLLDEEPVRDLLATSITCQWAFLGDEAVVLATLGDLADGSRRMSTLALLGAWHQSSKSPQAYPLDRLFSLLYRCFILPADIAGYRHMMRRYQDVVGSTLFAKPDPHPAVVKQATAIEKELESRGGFFSLLLAPPLSGAIGAQMRGKTLHDVAGVLVAATRARLAGESLAASPVPAALAALPRDPFTADKPLIAKRSDDGWVVYSVGPDGEDDGGPAARGADAENGSDDVGLRMPVP